MLFDLTVAVSIGSRQYMLKCEHNIYIIYNMYLQSGLCLLPHPWKYIFCIFAVGIACVYYDFICTQVFLIQIHRNIFLYFQSSWMTQPRSVLWWSSFQDFYFTWYRSCDFYPFWYCFYNILLTTATTSAAILLLGTSCSSWNSSQGICFS